MAPSAAEPAIAAMNAVTAMEPSEFLQVVAPLPELDDTTWELDAFRDHAAAAVQTLPGLNRFVYKMVPKSLPESEFFRLFFCHAYNSVINATTVSQATLLAGDDTTSSAIIRVFDAETTFHAFAKSEMDDILKRDAEDDEKLAAGIRMAIQKDVCAAKPPVEPITTIDVLGKRADVVASDIVSRLGDDAANGCVLVLQGLSGTGKGTTVSKLEEQLPRATCWSNGNVFRSLTLLAVTKCEKEGIEFGQEVLTADLLAELMGCLSFGKFRHDGKFDIRVKGYGLDLLVSQVANTTLKDPKVGKNIPTVAEMTQGEVITFAAAAAEKMRADGMNVLMEGRAQTLNYVRTPHRFELMLSQPLVIGKRRAAQRMMGAAQAKLKSLGKEIASPTEVTQILNLELKALAK